MTYTLLIKNCGQILTMKGMAPRKGRAMSDLGIIEKGFVACEGDTIAEVGKMKNLKRSKINKKTKIIDAKGKVVMPGLIDCHTHLVFAGSRAHEFKLKMEGKSYLDILAAGGGILSTVKATREASKKKLVDLGLKRLDEMLAYGITTVEAKSGYGLDMENEIKILDVCQELSAKHKVNVVPTFLGAHTVPPEYKGKSNKYLRFLMDEVLPAAKEKAEFVDIFCEKGAFTLRQSKKYLRYAKTLGFKIKIHAEQINNLGGCKLATKLEAVSCDHCDHIKMGGIKRLAKSNTVGVLLPIVPLYTREKVYADGRKMIDAGCAIAVSTDFNPGSAPSKNIFLAMSLACLKMNMTPEEVLTAATINAACALDLQKTVGSLKKGKRADIVIMDTEDYQEIPYWLGENLVNKVIIGGV